MPEPLTMRRLLVHIPGPTACWSALAFLWFSFSPSLLPRDAVIQAVVSALAIALGLGIGTLFAALVRKVLTVLNRQVPTVIHDRWWTIFGIASALVTTTGLVLWLKWQNTQRDLVSMDHLGPASALTVLFLTPIIAAILVELGRVISYPVRLLDRALSRRLPTVAARTIGVVVTALVAIVISRDVVASRIVNSVNTSFGYVDTTTAEGITQPDSSMSSGGPGSLVRWEDLGYQGRTFAGSASSLDELQAFAGPDVEVMEPIRAYVGLQSADSPTEQAELAVRELERTGAFERSVLVIATVTGTGWINPDAANSIELMYGGDTAIVGIQYSYLPSWISFILDLDKASDSGTAIIDAVHARWEQTPPETRPKLIVYGESLGSYGSEEHFAGADLDDSLNRISSQVDGVLWVGPTFANSIWHQVVSNRKAGSPTWNPVIGDGSRVTVLGHPDDPPVDYREHQQTPVVYLSHPSDPVTWSAISTLWKPPQWMETPIGYDVTDDARWFPGVTFIQSLFDLMAGFSAPPGHGHDYRPSLAAGWAAIVAPEGWTASDTERLQATIDTGS